jgi:hypothetical protein
MLAARGAAAARDRCPAVKHENPRMALAAVAGRDKPAQQPSTRPRSIAPAPSKLMTDPLLAAKHKTTRWADEWLHDNNPNRDQAH